MAAEPVDLPLNVGSASVAAADPVMAAFIERHGPYAIRPSLGDPFASLARAIIYQQLAGRAASAIHARFTTAIGGLVSPSAILDIAPEQLRSSGLSQAKVNAVRDLAARVQEGTLPLDQLPSLTDEEIIRALSAVRGVGRWTAEMFLLFELRRPDVWPVTDYGVRVGWTRIYQLPELITPKLLHEQGERFRPYRSAVAECCWHAVSVLRSNGQRNA